MKGITLQGIAKTLLTTRNFWRVPSMLLDVEKKESILFYGYPPIDCSYTEFCGLRNIICNGYKFSKLKKGKWIVELQKGYRVFGDNRILGALTEPLEQHYHFFDYNDKTVLDIGGFMGETAVLFASWGAHKVIIYEPMPDNAKWLKLNVILNGIIAEIHIEGIGDHDGEVVSHYDVIGPSFGLHGQGEKTVTIKLRSVTDVIRTSRADIAKIDCEGAESHLLEIPNDVLHLIPSWIIECHSDRLTKEILKKFKEAGYAVERKLRLNPEHALLGLKWRARTSIRAVENLKNSPINLTSSLIDDTALCRN